MKKLFLLLAIILPFTVGDGWAATCETADCTASSVSSTEFGYLDGVTSAIQTQLNASCLESVFGDAIEADDFVLSTTTLSLVGEIPHLDVAETITGNWVNTANPWADNEVADDITIDLATAATTATNIVVTDNESTNENNAILFTSGGDLDGSTSIGIESDGNLYYNPSTGLLHATTFEADASDDPATYYDPATASESEWWTGVNHDSVGDDNDAFEIRQSATPGTNVRVSIAASTGDITTSGVIKGRASYGADITGAVSHDTTATHGVFYHFTAAATVTLDAAADAGYGAQVCYRVRDASEAAVIDVQAGEKINLSGTALAAGTAITATGAGESVCMVATTDTDGSGTDGWEAWGPTDSWASE